MSIVLANKLSVLILHAIASIGYPELRALKTVALCLKCGLNVLIFARNTL
jgi:hypothetical protein